MVIMLYSPGQRSACVIMDPKALLLLLLTQLAVCLCAERETTEERLYQSAEWRDTTQLMIFTKPRSLPAGFLKAIQHAVNNDHVMLYEVACPDAPGAGEVCRALADTRMAVRVDGEVRGLATPSHGYDSEAAFVAAVLEQLLASSITRLTSYTDFDHYTSNHPKHLLLLTPDTESEEYAALLAALLTWPLPVAVAMTANVLPLSRRPRYSLHPPPLRMWYVEQETTGQLWYPFQDPEQFMQHSLNIETSPAKLVADFVQRFQYPIIVHYDDDASLASLFSDFALHLAVVFPGLSGASDIEPLPFAVGVAQKTFMNYAFVLVDRSRDSDYCSRLFITDHKPHPHVVILPYGREMNIIDHEVKGQELATETQKIANILDSILMEYPKVNIGEAGFVGLGPSITDVQALKFLLEEKKCNVLGFFCRQDDDGCINKAYSIVRDVLGVVRRTELGRSFAGHVVQSSSEGELKEQHLYTLPGLAVYNRTTKSWTADSGDVLSRSNAIQFLSKLTGMSDLKEIAESLFHSPPPMNFAPPTPPPLQEEEQLNLVLRSLQRPTIPHQIQLTSKSFDQHIRKFLKSVVVFCVKWSIRCKAFFHHLVAAHKQLDKTLNVSLALVRCDDYTELCTRLNITTYPTVLVFTPSTLNSPTPLTGILDSTHLLMALSQSSDEPELTPSVAELIPSSLPSLLGGGDLERTLLLWCSSDPASEVALEFLNQVSRENHPELTPAWINSTKHTKLMSHILPDAATFPSVAAINFKQHSVYHLAAEEDPKVFKEKLSSFLSMLSQQTLTPSGHLEEKAWLPLQPPLPFPSVDTEEEWGEFHGDGFDEGAEFDGGEFDEERYFNDGEFEFQDRLRQHTSNKPHPSTPPTTQQQHQHTEL